MQLHREPTAAVAAEDAAALDPFWLAERSRIGDYPRSSRPLAANLHPSPQIAPAAGRRDSQ